MCNYGTLTVKVNFAGAELVLYREFKTEMHLALPRAWGLLFVTDQLRLEWFVFWII